MNNANTKIIQMLNVQDGLKNQIQENNQLISFNNQPSVQAKFINKNVNQMDKNKKKNKNNISLFSFGLSTQFRMSQFTIRMFGKS